MLFPSPPHRFFAALVVALCCCRVVAADDVGQPTALLVQPANVVLTGARDMQQLVVLGRYPDGSERDLTRDCTFTAEPAAVVEAQPDGLLLPRQDGTATLTITAAGQKTSVSVTVRDFANAEPISFRRHL